MSLKDEIEKLIQAEQEKQKIEYRKNEEFRQLQEERFKPLTSLLKEISNSVEREFLDIKIFESNATVSVGVRRNECFDVDMSWEIHPNYESNFTLEEGEPMFVQAEGFTIEGMGEKELSFETEQEVVEYLIKEMAKSIGHRRYLKERDCE